MFPIATPKAVNTVAEAFRQELRQEIGESNFQEVVKRNLVADPGVCHSHDFCDANVVMLRVFHRLFPGVSTDDLNNDPKGNRLWNSAWETFVMTCREPKQTQTGKVLAFDCFGTVFDLTVRPREELKAYAEHLRRPEWSPLQLPKEWEHLPAHLDAREGISRLRRNFMVVTCSNGPLGLLAKLSKNAGISWDAIIPLEMNKVFKTNPKAYLTVTEVLGIEPSQMTMVTSNEKFGDLEAARALGMTAILVDRASGRMPRTIIELAEILGV